MIKIVAGKKIDFAPISCEILKKLFSQGVMSDFIQFFLLFSISPFLGHIDGQINLSFYSVTFLFQGSNYIFQRWFFEFFMQIKVIEKSKTI
jgi:hypothetical protein